MRPSRTGPVLLVGVLALVAAGCGRPSTAASDKSAASQAGSTEAVASPTPRASAGGSSGPAASPAPAQGSASAIGTTVNPATADVVEAGDLDVRCSSPGALRSAYAAMSTLASSAGGFVAASTLANGRVPSASMTLRVPNSSLPGVLARIGALGRVTSQTLSGQDVTGQVVDLSVEITNLTSEEAAVRHLLSDAGSVRDILTVQQQLFTLQDEIQQLKAQSDSLDNRIQYATLVVALSTVTAAPVPVRHHPTTLARFAHLAGSHTVALARGVFLAIGWSAPGLALLAVLAGALAVLRRRRTLRPAAPAGAGPDA
jgi:Domain of unknown function (DUF4349)